MTIPRRHGGRLWRARRLPDKARGAVTAAVSRVSRRRAGGVSAPWRLAVTLLNVVTVLLGTAGGASAIPTDPEPPACVQEADGTLSVSATTIESGQAVTVTWTTTAVAYCPTLQYELVTRLTGDVFGESWPAGTGGSKVLRPTGNTTVYLNATWGAGTGKALRTASIEVLLPSQDGRNRVVISSNSQKALFLQAIDTPNTTIRLADGLNLDLTHQTYMHIARGVHILGNRSTTNPGPRIFTTSAPSRFFMIGAYLPGDGVRISGVRIDGGEMGIADKEAPTPFGITINASVNVTIENSEIYGWAGGGVQVKDDNAGYPDRLNLENTSGVLVRGNYIHHNQHYRRFGYGVEVQDNAYATIEQNVFDYNRHAIASDGLAGTGYLAYRNLVLENGGNNSSWGFDTHQFDVHGTEDCWPYTYYCGDAGQYFDMRYNAFYYVAGDVVKVRGEPHIRADVRDNVFADTNPSEAIVQTVDGVNVIRSGNRFGLNTRSSGSPVLSCDFDGDGGTDRFLATGITWWYQARTGHWMYLNTSRKLAGEVTLGDFTGDGRCDVRAKDTGEVFASGRTTAARADVLWCSPATGGTRLWQVKNGVATANIMPPAFAPGCTVLGGGDFNADGIADLVYRNASNEVFVTLLTAVGGREVPAGSRTERQGVMPATSALAGVGDFNADNRSDLLWRHANGDLEMWLGGESGNRSYPSWLNDPARKTGNEWQIKSLGDFDGDGRSDILWRHDNGSPAIWFMNGEYYAGEVHTPFNDPTAIWKIQTTGDFDGDGRSDILWRHNDGGLAIWFRGQSNLAAYPSWLNQGGRTSLDWQIKAVADINADRRDDIIWQNNNGNVVSWVMDGGRFVTEFLTGVGPAGYNLLRALPSTPR